MQLHGDVQVRPRLFTATRFPNHLLQNQETPVTSLFPKCSEGARPPGGTEAYSVYWKKQKQATTTQFLGATVLQHSRVPTGTCLLSVPGTPSSRQRRPHGVPAQPPWTEAWVSPACLTRLLEAHMEAGMAPGLPSRVLSTNTALVERARPVHVSVLGPGKQGPGRWEERAEAPS